MCACKASVLVVCYNHEQWIARALDSVLAQQTDFPVEIVIADDCSTDRTVQIIRDYQVRYPDLIVLLESRANLGITKNYQRGFAACQGTYIAVLEGDDYWLARDRLKTMVNFLDDHPECAFGFNRVQVIGSQMSAVQQELPRGIGGMARRLINRAARITRDEVPAQGGSPNQMLQWDSRQPYELLTGSDLAKENFVGNFSACVYRAALVHRLDESLYAMKMYDWLFNLSISRWGLIGYIPQALSVYRQHDAGSWSSITIDQKLRDILALIPVYDVVLERVYSASFAVYERQITLQLEISRLRQMLRQHRRNPFVILYALLGYSVQRSRIYLVKRLGKAL